MKRFCIPLAWVIIGLLMQIGSVQAQTGAPASIDSLVDLSAPVGGLTGTWSVTEDYGSSGVFTATWTFTPLVGNISKVHAERPGGYMVDGIEISPANFPVDVVVHPSYGSGSTCKYIFVGSASSSSFSGNVTYKCTDGSSVPGTFSATRVSAPAPAQSTRGARNPDPR